MSLLYEVLPVGDLQCNSVILYDPDSKEAVLFDPGDEAENILNSLKRLSCKIISIVHTHAHFDHVMATEKIIKENSEKIPLYLHQEDKFLWEKLSDQTASFGMPSDIKTLPQIDKWLKDDDIITIGGEKIKTIHTPGHSPGSCCFFYDNKDNPILISGDTVFYGSIGRTDLWGGDMSQLMNSIHDKIIGLPDETKIIPGHGPSTTISEEKKHNPFFVR
ncbi:MAG: MBL fold metallo-hydrolase [Spirochaetia bacterium]|nr:MBL fold metallo-hydrolase [Spirochaetia bacterium]